MKILASDIDGTLVRKNEGHQRSIHPDDIRALKTWTKENVLIVSTGRNKISLFALFDAYGLTLPHTFYMTSSGAEVYDENRVQIFAQKLNADICRKAAQVIQMLSQKYALLLTVYNGEKKIEITMDDPDQDWQNQPAVNICVESVHQDLAAAKDCFDQLNSALEEAEVHMNQWYIDIVPKHISKAKTIQYLISHQICAASELIAIGDSYNDICMFEIADRSYTFHDSPDCVKKAADHCVSHVYTCVQKELVL